MNLRFNNRHSEREKIFCIGLNKTGTTSLEKILRDWGYKMGDQRSGELLFKNWIKRDFKSILKFSKTAEAFQDVPFSLPYTYITLDQYFSKARFILTVRDSPLQWYKSLWLFHSKLWADGIKPATSEDLKNAKYLYNGFAYEFVKAVFKTPDEDPYNKEILHTLYTNYNDQVADYFKNRPEKLLVINVSRAEDYYKLSDFLNKQPIHKGFPWENKTSEIL